MLKSLLHASTLSYIILGLLGSVLITLPGCPRNNAANDQARTAGVDASAAGERSARDEAAEEPYFSPITWLSVSSLDKGSVFPLGDLFGKPLVISFFAMY